MTLKVVWLPVLGHSMIKCGLMLGISVCMEGCWWDLKVVCWAAGGHWMLHGGCWMAHKVVREKGVCVSI